MSWTSPRREKEHAAQLREFFASEAERELGRPLTADELKDLSGQAAETAAACRRETNRPE